MKKVAIVMLIKPFCWSQCLIKYVVKASAVFHIKSVSGRKWRPARMPDSDIKLPVDSNGNPDWQFMENYIKSLPYSGSLQNDTPIVKFITTETIKNQEKGLSDKELIEKYEAGKINLKSATKKMLSSLAPGIEKRQKVK